MDIFPARRWPPDYRHPQSRDPDDDRLYWVRHDGYRGSAARIVRDGGRAMCRRGPSPGRAAGNSHRCPLTSASSIERNEGLALPVNTSVAHGAQLIIFKKSANFVRSLHSGRPCHSPLPGAILHVEKSIKLVKVKISDWDQKTNRKSKFLFWL